MENIFSTRQRVKILQNIIFKANTISVNNIAKQLKLSKGLVSKYFDILRKEKILKRADGKFLVADSSIVKGIRVLLNVRHININIFKKYSFVRTAGLYGSCAKGDNLEDSDIDLWIKVDDISDGKLASLTSEINKKIIGAKIIFLTDKKIAKLKKEDELFYHSLVFGSIILYGASDGIQI